MTCLDRVREALGRTRELIRAYISSSEVKELRAETVTLNTENLRITEVCEQFEHAVRELLEVSPADPAIDPPAEEVNEDQEEEEQGE